MKNYILSFITALMVVILAACGSDGESAQSNKEAQKTEQIDSEEVQKKLDEQKVDEKTIVAVVNDKEISGIDYNMVLSATQMQLLQMGQDPTDKELAELLKKQTLDNLVGQELLLQVSHQKGYQASEDEVKKQLDEMRKQYPSEKEFETAMSETGLDVSKLETQLAESIQISKYVDEEITIGEVSEAEIKEYYDEAKGVQDLPSLEEIKPQIKQALEQQKKQEKLLEEVEKLKKDAEIDYKI